MKAKINWPLYLVIQDGKPPIVSAEGCDFFLIYSNQELGELYVQQARQAGADCQLEPLEPADTLRVIAQNPDVIYYALDNVLKPENIRLVPADDLKESAEQEL